MAKREDTRTRVRVSTEGDAQDNQSPVEEGYDELLDRYQKELAQQDAKHKAVVAALVKERDEAKSSAAYLQRDRDALQERVGKTDKERSDLEQDYLQSLEQVQDSKHRPHRLAAWFFLWVALIPTVLIVGILGTVYPVIHVYHGQKPVWLWLSALSMAVLLALFSYLHKIVHHKPKVKLSDRYGRWEDQQ